MRAGGAATLLGRKGSESRLDGLRLGLNGILTHARESGDLASAIDFAEAEYNQKS
jgi:hypothetical protein